MSDFRSLFALSGLCVVGACSPAVEMSTVDDTGPAPQSDAALDVSLDAGTDMEITPDVNDASVDVGVDAGCESDADIDLDWSSPFAIEERQAIPPGGVLAFEFTTTSNPAYGGQLSIASTTGNSGVSRRAWISDCPQGLPLGATVEDPDGHPRCSAMGTSSTVIRWHQGDEPTSYCLLGLNTTYYLNIENLNCPEEQDCDVYLHPYNNGES